MTAESTNANSFAEKAIDLALSGIEYRADRMENPIETQWLTSGQDGTIWGVMWEETRLIERIVIEYAKAVPDMLVGRDLAIERWVGRYSWWVGEWKPEFAHNTHVPTGSPVVENNGLRFVYRFDQPVQAEKLRVRLYLTPLDTAVTLPEIRIYGPASCIWHPLEIRIEPTDGGSFATAKVSAYNGSVQSSKADGEGLVVKALIGDEEVKIAQPEQDGSSARPEDAEIHYDNLRLEDKTSNRLLRANRTILTVERGDGEGFSFLPGDLLTGEPIYCPDHRVVVSLAEMQVSSERVVSDLAARAIPTRRQMTAAYPEQSYDRAMKAAHGDLKVEYPTAPAEERARESMMRIDIPEKPLQDAWEIGAWHLKRHCPENPDGSRAIVTFPYCPLGQESYLTIRVMDYYGMHDVTRQGLQHWMNQQGRRAAWGYFTDHDGALILSHDDGRHALGPGAVLWVLAEHHALAGDDEWLEKAVPSITTACRWIIRQRRTAMDRLLKGRDSWMMGLQPPCPIGDSMDWRPFYIINAFFYAGLENSADMMARIEPAIGEELKREAEQYRQDILKAMRISVQRSPMKKIRSGVYRPVLPMAPFVRGMASDFMRPDFGWTWIDIEFGALWLARTGVLPVDDPLIDSFLDVVEDCFHSDNRMLRARKPDFDPERDWFDHAGYHWQHGYNVMPWMYLQKDEIESFLRAFYNMYACLIEPGNGYTFREHATVHPVHDKPFEEAAFLERLRHMLVMEEDGALWLAKATPRTWLRDGQKISISNAPTRFGKIGYCVASELGKGRIAAEVEAAFRHAPGKVLLRFRHPEKSMMKRVLVDGEEWEKFDPGTETICLPGHSGRMVIEALY